MQCIETRDCGGLREPDAAPCTIEHVAGACASDGSCAVGECRARRVCSSGAADGGCGCRVWAQHGAAWPATLALLAGLALLRRRRR
ncbi:MAG: MYXO-CTERM sorting domain-containing protein [Sandaracinaceae bacterium]|nr:MYXO-CTERM sorting domain-containing protein [Sandaracinaceae bacterium]